jgi:glutamate-ammonia-ligase adenylyltransferase
LAKEKIIYPDTVNADLAVERYKEINRRIGKKEKDILYLLSSHSRFIGRVSLSDPGLVAYVTSGNFQKKKKELPDYNDELAKILNESTGEEDFGSRLRIYKYREFARIIYKDIALKTDFISILEELSDLAEAIINVVYLYFEKNLETKKYGHFFILAMGKLGGRLLNLSSDVDLIYIFKEKKDYDCFFKLAEKITKTISSVTDQGFLYRVDLGLRPGGNKSTIAVPYEGAVEHYFYWGDTWERAALIQARPISGNIELGNRFIKDIDQFVYKKSLDYESIEDLKDMKVKLDQLKKLDDVKLGKGGIREIEFFVQANQLVNAGQFQELKGLNPMDCLDPLRKRKILTRGNMDDLTRDYIFLRRVEHNLQIVDELQTQKIPTDKNELLKLSNRLGIKTVKSFQKEYLKTTDNVSSIYNKLFFESTEKIEEYGNEFWHLADFLTEGNISEEEAVDSLKNLGFENPNLAVDLISTLIDTKRGALTQKGRMFSRRVIPAFLGAVLKSYNPDVALLNLERFITSIGWKSSIYAVLLENPELLKLLSRFFSTSGVLSNFLIRHPEYLDVLTQRYSQSNYSDKNEMADVVRGLIENEDDYEGKLNALRHFKHVETLKLCLRDLNRELDSVFVAHYLSMIASSILTVALELAIRETRLKYRKKSSLNKICILAMGKFGSSEMSYNSDLDIIFIYEGNDHESYSRVGQRLISILSVPTIEGACYEVDLDLRPSGRSGTLVTSYESFKKYHEESAQLWERQALIRAVPSAGDKKLSEKVLKTVTDYVYNKPLDDNFYLEINRLRNRMEKELAKESVSKVNIKTGKGGLVDIEFIVQMLQLRYGKKNRSIRHGNTLEAINALGDKGLVGPKEASCLIEGYKFLKRMENLLRLLKDKSISDVKDSDFDRLAIESRTYKKGKELKNRYKYITHQIRNIYRKYFKL